MTIDANPLSVAHLGEQDLRRQINRSVGRALTDRDYATLLLADPTLVLEDRGCAPQHYRLLRTIKANDLEDFAHQAYSLFWSREAASRSIPQQDATPLTAAAS